MTSDTDGKNNNVKNVLRKVEDINKKKKLHVKKIFNHVILFILLHFFLQ